MSVHSETLVFTHFVALMFMNSAIFFMKSYAQS